MLTLPKRADKSRFSPPTLTLIVIGLVFLVAACGGSDSTSTAASTESQTQPSTASSATVTEPNQIGNRKVGGEVGMNRFVWDMRHEPSREAPGDESERLIAGPGLDGPLVAPGTYSVRLDVDGS